MSDSANAARVPWWVTLADVVTLALVGAAVAIGVAGGYRGRIAGVVVSLTSPLRLVLAAAVVAAIRHGAFPRPSVIRRAGTALAHSVGCARGWLRAPAAGDSSGARPVGPELVAVSGLMIVLTIAMLYPFARHLDRVPDTGDPLFSIWRIGWVAHQLRVDPVHLYDATVFWPERYALAYSDGMPLTGVAAAPFIWLGASPVIVASVFVLVSFVLSGVAMYLLVRSLVGNPWPAVVSAVAFAFYPFRYEHLLHLELLSAFWMPLALWALHQAMTAPGASRRWRMGLLAGAALAAQYLSGMYLGVFLGSFMVVVWVTLAAARRWRAVAAKPLLAGVVLAGVLVLPTLPPYVHVRQAIGERDTEQVQKFSARPVDYITPQQPNPRQGGCNERQVFPGFLIVALAVAAFWPPLSGTRVAYLLGLAFAFDVSLGSNGLIHPYLYGWVLPFRGLRAPARASMLVGLSLAVLAGFGGARLIGLLRRRRWQAACAAVLCAVVLVEPRPPRSAMPVPAIPPVYSWFRTQPLSTIAEVPMWYGIADHYLLYQTAHWQRMVNGFSGSIPASYPPLHVAMRSFPDEHSIRLLRAYGVSYAVIHEEFYGPDDYRRMTAAIDRLSSLTLAHVATDGRFEARIYRVIP